jgi:hypothetical protein
LIPGEKKQIEEINKTPSIPASRLRTIPARFFTSVVNEDSETRAVRLMIIDDVFTLKYNTPYVIRVERKYYSDPETLRKCIYDQLNDREKSGKNVEDMQIFVMGHHIEKHTEYHELQTLFDAINVTTPNKSALNYYIYFVGTNKDNCAKMGMHKGQNNRCHYKEYNMTDISIDISEHTFNLKVRFFDGTRFYVLIHNVTEGVDFVCYMSCSQGLWRLCVREEYNVPELFKGDDYTAGSIISFRLQEFIMSNYYRLEEIQYEKTQCVHMNYDLMRQLKSKERIKKLGIHIDTDTPEVQYLKKVLNIAIDPAVVKAKAESLKTEFKTAASIVHVYGYTVPPLPKKDYDDVKTYLEKQRDITPKQRKYFGDNVIRMSVDLKYVRLTSKTYDLKMYCICVKDFIIGADNKTDEQAGPANIPVLIIPWSTKQEEENINQYGLYKKQYAYREYVHKPFEYTAQCRGRTGVECTEHYSFVGRFWDGLFPF